MIVVTGSKRSGTSMWMQILRAAGLPIIGEALPERFRALREANPDGFFESRLRKGIYYRTNPDPDTGVYLHPDATRRHVVKVFVPGLVRSDHAFLDRVLATVRPWREYVASMQRLRAMEDAALIAEQRFDTLERRLARRAQRPHALHWWDEVHDLLRDSATRGYPCRIVGYDRLLRQPRTEITAVLAWIGAGDVDAAVAAVKPSRRTQLAPEIRDPGVDDEAIAVFDDIYAAIDATGGVGPELAARIGRLRQRIPGPAARRPHQEGVAAGAARSTVRGTAPPVSR